MKNKISIGFNDFFKNEIVQTLYSELLNDVKFERVELGKQTKLFRGERELGKVYDGKILFKKNTKQQFIINNCLQMFHDQAFIEFLSKIVGTPVHFLREATPYKFQKGDYLCLHDDLSHPKHCIEVVINLTKNWERKFGGLSLIGKIKRIENVMTPDYLPFQLRKIYLDRSKKYSLVTPKFNTLSIIKLSTENCHGVTKIRHDSTRIVLACIYGGHEMQKPTTIWKH
ncbi:MAG: hypothetical protein WC879_10325 [Melioribacteraceae bacterium]